MTGWSFIVILECFECFPLFRVIWHLSIGLTQRSRWCGPKFPICIWSRHMSQWHRGWRLPAVWLVLSLYLSNEIFNYWSFCTISLSACLSACLSFVLAVLVHLSHIFFIPLSEAAYQKSMWNDLVVEVVVVGMCVYVHIPACLCAEVCVFMHTHAYGQLMAPCSLELRQTYRLDKGVRDVTASLSKVQLYLSASVMAMVWDMLNMLQLGSKQVHM